MRYLEASMAGSYYVPCVLERQEVMMGETLYHITYFDSFANQDRTVIVKKDRLREIPTGVTHKVKSWAHFFDAIKEGHKTHELRHNDRDYQVGDYMLLQRYDNINGKYTGEECTVEITYITNREKPCAFSGSVLDRDYCILSIRTI